MATNAEKGSNAWWWDHHISPNSSKWLPESLKAMDERVKQMLSLIEAKGDSFAEKAESYYQKRPQLVAMVEDFYGMYRSLAERYSHLTGELHKNVPSFARSPESDARSPGSDKGSMELEMKEERIRDLERKLSEISETMKILEEESKRRIRDLEDVAAVQKKRIEVLETESLGLNSRFLEDREIDHQEIDKKIDRKVAELSSKPVIFVDGSESVGVEGLKLVAVDLSEDVSSGQILAWENTRFSLNMNRHEKHVITRSRPL